MKSLVIIKLIMIIAITSVVRTTAVQAESDQYVESEEEKLVQGRILWLATCESCHAYGIADAPVPMRPEDWRFRLKKPREELYDHAIKGFIGPDYSMMPARGGNDDLSDNEVKLAVDYMIFLASYYINKQTTD